MSASAGVSRAGLHALLWDLRQSDNTVRVVQTVLAEKLLISRFQLNRILKQLVVEGRLEMVTTKGGPTNKTFLVVDPAAWAAQRGARLGP